MSPRFQAPKGTFDVLPADAAARDRLTHAAADVLGRAGYGASRRRCSRTPSCSRAASAGSTDIVRKEMFTFDGPGRAQLTLRPEGTAPIARAYVEHGMHKLRAAGEALVLGPVLPLRAPAGGPLPPVQPARRRGDRLRLAARRRRADHPARRAAARARRARARAAARRASARPTARAAYRDELRAYLRAHEAELARDVRERIDENPLRAFDSKDEATRAVMAEAPTMLDRLDGDDAEHFEAVRRLLDEAGRRLRARRDPGARPRLLHAHRVRVRLRPARRAVRGRRRRPLRRPDRAARRAGDARRRLGGGDRAHPARARRGAGPEPAIDVFVAARRRPARARLRARRASCAARACAPTSTSPGRWLKGQMKQADRARRPPRGDPRRGRLGAAARHGKRRAARGSTWRRVVEELSDSAGQTRPMSAPSFPALRANEYRDTWCGQVLADRVGRAVARRGLGAPPPRPRRADLHRPARPHRPRPARLQPRRGRRRRSSSATGCAPRT